MGLLVVQFAFSSSRGCRPSRRGNGDALGLPWAEPAGTEAAGRVERSCSAERASLRCFLQPLGCEMCDRRWPCSAGFVTSQVTEVKTLLPESTVKFEWVSQAVPGPPPSLLVDPVLPGTRLLPTVTTVTRESSRMQAPQEQASLGDGSGEGGLFAKRPGKQELVRTRRCVPFVTFRFCYVL